MINHEYIAMVAYTDYDRDPRVRRYSEALVDHGYSVDCYILNNDNKLNIENKNGVNLHYLGVSQYRGNSNIAYIISYLKFFFYSFAKLIRNRKKYSIVHVHNMPDFLVFSSIINKMYGAKIILDIHDNMPELYKAKFTSFISHLAYHLLLFQEKISCYFSDAVITVHEPHLEHNVKFHGLNEKKAYVIRNFADPKLFNVMKYKKQFKNDKFTIIYHGTIAERFGLKIVLQGLASIIKEFPFIHFNIYGKGDGVDSLLKDIYILSLDNNVTYHGQVPLDQLPKIIADADLGIVSYIHNDATNLMLPLKLMEYITMEIPVLTVKNKSIGYYFNENDLAYYKSGDSKSFAKELSDLISSSKKIHELKNRTCILNERLNWKSEKEKYLNIIKTLNGNIDD